MSGAASEPGLGFWKKQGFRYNILDNNKYRDLARAKATLAIIFQYSSLNKIYNRVMLRDEGRER